MSHNSVSQQHAQHQAHPQQQQQHHTPQATLPRTASTSSTAHNLLLEEFADDFDVSLSGLCLGPADNVVGSTLGGAPLPLMNTVFGSLGDIVKVEEEFSLGAAVAAAAGLGGHANGGGHGGHQLTHSPPDSVKETKLNVGGSGPGTLVGQQQHSAMLGHHSFDAHEAYYGALTNDTEDSCQSDTYSSSDTASIRNKPVLQTVLENIIQDEKNSPNSKRLCFKGLVEPKESAPGTMAPPLTHHSMSHHQQQQQGGQHQMVATNQTMTSGQAAALIGPLTINDMNDPFFSNPLNVANAYGYAWRRWSKTDAPPVKNNKSGSIQQTHTMAKMDEADNRDFQYILGAPTAAGTKLAHMTMTYLNQGQSYEIRLKKLKKIPNEANLKTCVRLGFVEKRLQYRENEEMANWSMLHQKDRLLDIDFTMSYGVFDVNLNSTYNHCINFVWNPGREASIFIKINCISTEFTSKRHGGERGAPLRLVVETLSTVDGSILDGASCLIKVFKSKGAERKHKTDRDRMSKLPDAELHYQPSYDCTLLTAYKEEPLVPPNAAHAGGGGHSSALDSIASSPSATPPISCSTPGPGTASGEWDSTTDSRQLTTSSLGGLQSGDSPTPTVQPRADQAAQHGHRPSQDSGYMGTPISVNVTVARSESPMPGQQHSISSPISTSDSVSAHPSSTLTPAPSTPNSCSQLPQSTSHIEENPFFLTGSSGSSSATTNCASGGGSGSASGKGSSGHLALDAGAIETYEWLKRNRFFRLAEQLCDYTADDLRRLSREDLIQLCDLKDGIRLFNLIHTPEGPTTKLTIFITVDGSEHYALYFKSLSVEEFRDKLAETFQDASIKLRHLHMIGPNGIRVKLTNNVIANMKNESVYICMLNKVDDEYDIALRLSSQ